MGLLDNKLTPIKREELINYARGKLPVDYSKEMTIVPVFFEEQSSRIPMIIRDRKRIECFFDGFYTRKGMCTIIYKTTEEWGQLPDLVGAKNTIYVYLDKYSYVDEHGETIYVPGVKLGDGTSKLQDIPFLLDASMKWLFDHIHDRTVHIQPGEREFWNNKLNYVEPENELLRFTRD